MRLTDEPIWGWRLECVKDEEMYEKFGVNRPITNLILKFYMHWNSQSIDHSACFFRNRLWIPS